MDREDTLVIKQVDQWLREFIIKYNICPFAKVPYQNGQVRIQTSPGSLFEEQLLFFSNELTQVAQNPSLTTLAIFPGESSDFEEFLDFVAACEALRDDLGLSEDFQLVAFHPEFRFDSLPRAARANMVNRSPYPLIHILSASQISVVMTDPSEGERISLKNEERLNSLPETEWREIEKLIAQPLDR